VKELYKERKLIALAMWGPLGDSEIVAAWQADPYLPNRSENRESARLTVLAHQWARISHDGQEFLAEEFLCQTQDADNPVRILVQRFDDSDKNCPPNQAGLVVWKEE